MMLTGNEKAPPLTFFYPECEERKLHRKRTCVMLLEESRTSMIYAGGTRNKRKSDKKGDLAYGEDFVIDKIVLSDMMDSPVGLDEVLVPQEIDLVNDTEQVWIDDCCSEPEVEFEPETSRPERDHLDN